MINHQVSNHIVTENNQSGKRERATLSCGAYFDTSTTIPDQTGSSSPKVHPFHAWIELRKANRVKRGSSAEKTFRVDVHADMLKITRPRPLTGLPEYPMIGGGKRGKIKGFSDASRKRLIEQMASIRNTGFKMFLTMTYDDTAYMQSYGHQKAQFEAFRRRFERGFPSWSALWRIETQTRKSGILKGTPVPHMHLIIFSNAEVKEEWQDKLSEMFRQWGAEAWQEITGSTDENHLIHGFHVTPVRSRKHAYHYVSKYVGKIDTDVLQIGRRWGRIVKFDISSSEVIRFDEDEIIIFKRLIKRWLRNRQKRYSRQLAKQNKLLGFTIFGLGDTTVSGEKHALFAPFEQFIVEVRRQRIEQHSSHEFWYD